MVRAGRNRRKKSLCEKSMELAVNIFNFSYLYLATMSFKPTLKLPTPPPPPARPRPPSAAAGDQDGLLSSFGSHAHQHHHHKHQQATRPHQKNQPDGDEDNIDERASSFIRRIKEKNQADYYWSGAGDQSKRFSGLLLPSPPSNSNLFLKKL